MKHPRNAARIVSCRIVFFSEVVPAKAGTLSNANGRIQRFRAPACAGAAAFEGS
jgi:hypothetical protein